MQKKTDKNEIEILLNCLSRFSEGASIGELKKVLPFYLPHRTLQRRLMLLVNQDKVKIIGQGRSTRYQILASESKQSNDNLIPLSNDGNVILQAIKQPIQKRVPTGYQRDFLDHYRPNQTFYLPEETRKMLWDIAQSSGNELPAGTYARQIFNRLLIDLSWNSSRLEGNTYSLLETERLLQMGKSADGKNALEAQMILNHKAAIEFLVESAENIGFNRYTISNLHALLSDNLLADSSACGRLRTIPVSISGTVYYPLEVPQLIDECFLQILDTADAISDPFEQSFFIMVQIPYLQPFEDVNKRVSRLAANIPLIRHNLSPLSFVDVPEEAYVNGTLGVYELNRTELLRDVFIWAYQRSSARYSAAQSACGCVG